MSLKLQVDIAGSLYYWDLSINTVTAVLLVLVVGLSVDYAAHVAHAFMRATGSQEGMHCNYLITHLSLFFLTSFPSLNILGLKYLIDNLILL